MSSVLTAPRSRSLLEMPAGVALPSLGLGADTRKFDQRLSSMKKLLTGAASGIVNVPETNTKDMDISEQLRVKLAALKKLTSAIAMYLDADWRRRLLATLDGLLDPDDWNSESALPSEQSFSTFLRMIIYLHPTRRPGIGLSLHGRFLAAWSRETDRITIECFGNDEVRWVLSHLLDGERETGAGTVSLHRIPDVTAGYDPEPLFQNGHKILA